MTLEEHRQLTTQLLERQPGLLFDALMMHQLRHGTPPFTGVPGGIMVYLYLYWYCVSRLPHFSQYCLEEGFLRIHRQYREELTVLGQVRGPGDDNREYRYAAYRHFIFWQHGSLGQGNRVVIPSCCVWSIRDKFPDPTGHYTGFIPGIWVFSGPLECQYRITSTQTCVSIIRASKQHPYLFYFLYLIYYYYLLLLYYFKICSIYFFPLLYSFSFSSLLCIPLFIGQCYVNLWLQLTIKDYNKIYLLYSLSVYIYVNMYL